MATDSILGLFTTPEQYQQGQLQQLYQNQLAQARLSPVEQASFNIGAGAQRAGDVLGRALGGEDPALKQLSIIRQLSSQFDTTTSGGTAALAQALAQQGLQGPAMQLGQKALEMRKLEAEAQAKTMERLTNEQKNAAALADSSGNPRGSTEWTETYKTELARLTAGSKGANIKEIGVAEGTRQPVYFDAGTDTQFIMGKDASGKQIRIPFSGGVDRTTAKTTVDARNMGESEFVKELGKLDAKKVSEAMTAKGAAIDQLKTLQKMAEVTQRPVISGTLAEQRTEVSNFFNTLGLSSNADRLKTANSQEYIKYSTGLVLDNLKKTGYNPSNADMKVVQSIIPRLETDPTARKELIKFMAEKANEVVNESTNLENYARDKKGLTGYVPKVPQVTFGGSAPNAASGLTTEQLKAIAGIK